MDALWETSSNPSGAQWSFLRDHDEPCSSGQSSRRPFQQLIGPQAQCPSSTIPTQPVTVRVHSADASSHLNPAPRVNKMAKRDELPPVSDFSIDAIMASIKPDIDGTIDAIAEILGRSKLSLANEYDSHMPPQGEIRAGQGSALLPVEEASPSSERFDADDVIIVPEDASLMEGSHHGSAAYGLLERLNTSPVARHNEFTYHRPFSSSDLLDDFEDTRPPIAAGSLLNYGMRANEPIVSEMHLSANANARAGPSMAHDLEDFPPYYEDLGYLDSPSEPRSRARSPDLQRQPHNISLVSDVRGLATWLHGDRRSRGESTGDAETRLRMLLGRQARQGTVERATSPDQEG